MATTASSRTELRDHVLLALASLGDDASGVAERLRDDGVRADPGDGGDCPVAMCLSAFVAGHDEVRSLHVTGKCVIIRFMKVRPFQLLVSLPVAVRSFVAEFDRGDYPELIREAAHVGTERQEASSR